MYFFQKFSLGMQLLFLRLVLKALFFFGILLAQNRAFADTNSLQEIHHLPEEVVYHSIAATGAVVAGTVAVNIPSSPVSSLLQRAAHTTRLFRRGVWFLGFLGVYAASKAIYMPFQQEKGLVFGASNTNTLFSEAYLHAQKLPPSSRNSGSWGFSGGLDEQASRDEYPQKPPKQVGFFSPDSLGDSSDEGFFRPKEQVSVSRGFELEAMLKDFEETPQEVIETKIRFVFEKNGYGPMRGMGGSIPKSIVAEFYGYKLRDFYSKYIFVSQILGFKVMVRSKLAKHLQLSNWMLSQYRQDVLGRFYHFITLYLRSLEPHSYTSSVARSDTGGSRESLDIPLAYKNHQVEDRADVRDKAPVESAENHSWLQDISYEVIGRYLHIHPQDLPVLKDRIIEELAYGFVDAPLSKKMFRYFIQLAGRDKHFLRNVAVNLGASFGEADVLLETVSDMFVMLALGLRKQYSSLEEVYADQMRTLEALEAPRVDRAFGEDQHYYHLQGMVDKGRDLRDFLHKYPKEYSHLEHLDIVRFVYVFWRFPNLHQDHLNLLGDDKQIHAGYSKIFRLYETFMSDEAREMVSGSEEEITESPVAAEDDDFWQVYSSMSEDMKSITNFELIKMALFFAADLEQLQRFYDLLISFFDVLDSDEERYVFLKTLWQAVPSRDFSFGDIALSGERNIAYSIKKRFVGELKQAGLVSQSTSPYPYFFSSFHSYEQTCWKIIQALTEAEVNYIVQSLRIPFVVDSRTFTQEVTQFVLRYLTSNKQKMLFFSMILKIVPIGESEVMHYISSLRSQGQVMDETYKVRVRFQDFLLRGAPKVDDMGLQRKAPQKRHRSTNTKRWGRIFGTRF